MLYFKYSKFLKKLRIICIHTIYILHRNIYLYDNKYFYKNYIYKYIYYYICEKKYYLIFIIFNMLFTTCENFRIQINLEIPKNALLKSNL